MFSLVVRRYCTLTAICFKEILQGALERLLEHIFSALMLDSWPSILASNALILLYLGEVSIPGSRQGELELVLTDLLDLWSENGARWNNRLHFFLHFCI